MAIRNLINNAIKYLRECQIDQCILLPYKLACFGIIIEETAFLHSLFHIPTG